MKLLYTILFLALLSPSLTCKTKFLPKLSKQSLIDTTVPDNTETTTVEGTTAPATTTTAPETTTVMETTTSECDTSSTTETTRYEPTSTTVAHETTTTPDDLWCWEETGFSKISRSYNDVTCTICSFLFQALDDILLENEGNIADALVELCNSVPSFLTQICEDLLGKCTDEIIETIIESGLNPEDICGGLGLCP
ncbi:uncharacterized protein LOC111718230 [Eurytemora carolleeae]|uniref:uncharacterized protein LOC111718230 n=1 Tax=Eurytemora carolleeae TaxID=1294199 RepID=UPI000C772C66|nr:uncharacterized protein LOC111718230 [Eurytemora carolleeae]|eukprot:XP_023349540.1 uncharacterized protein LOC111718230 [Eurytemora affinis]